MYHVLPSAPGALCGIGSSCETVVTEGAAGAGARDVKGTGDGRGGAFAGRAQKKWCSKYVLIGGSSLETRQADLGSRAGRDPQGSGVRAAAAAAAGAASSCNAGLRGRRSVGLGSGGGQEGLALLRLLQIRVVLW